MGGEGMGGVDGEGKQGKAMVDGAGIDGGDATIGIVGPFISCFKDIRRELDRGRRRNEVEGGGERRWELLSRPPRECSELIAPPRNTAPRPAPTKDDPNDKGGRTGVGTVTRIGMGEAGVFLAPLRMGVEDLSVTSISTRVGLILERRDEVRRIGPVRFIGPDLRDVLGHGRDSTGY